MHHIASIRNFYFEWIIAKIHNVPQINSQISFLADFQDPFGAIITTH
jgi:hypothetical protein